MGFIRYLKEILLIVKLWFRPNWHQPYHGFKQWTPSGWHYIWSKEYYRFASNPWGKR